MATRPLFIALLLLAATPPPSTLGQAPARTLIGRVVDERGHPIPAAVLYMENSNWNAVTDDQGIFQINPLPPLPISLYCRHLGYERQNLPIRLPPTQTDTVVIILKAVSLTLGEVFIEGDKRLDSWQTGQSPERMNAEDLRRQGGVTLMQALERLPGITQIQTGVGLAKPVIRGLSFNRVAVTDGNLRQEGQQWGIDHGLEVDPFQIDEVRIIKGPSGLLYGSDAMGGVIQLIPKPITPKNKMEGSVSLVGRSVNDHIGGNIALQGAINPALSWSIRATTHTYSDYRLPADSFSYNRFRIPLPGRRLENTAGREAHWAVGLRRTLDRGSTQITYKQFGQKIGFFPGAVGRPLEYKLDTNTIRRDVRTPYQKILHHRVDWQTRWQGSRGDWEIDLGGQYNDRRELSNPHAHGRRYLDSNQQLSHGMWLSTAAWNLRYQPHRHGSSRWLLGSSGQLQQNRIGGYEFLIPAYKSAQIGVFGVRNTALAPGWELLTGMRTDVSRQKSDAYTDSYPSDSGWVERLRAPALVRHYLSTTASAGLGWSDRAGNTFNLHLGNSYRIPTLPELASNGVHHGSFRHEQGDSSLKPEQGWQLDVGGTRKLKRLTCKGSAYFNYFSRYIYLRPTGNYSFLPEGGQIFRYTQGRVLHSGGEVQLDYKIDRSNTITATGEYVWMQNTATGVPLPWSPPPGIWLSWSRKFDPIVAPTDEKTPNTHAFFNIDWILVASQSRTDRNEDPTPGYNLIQLQAGWQRRFDDRCQVIVRLQAHNLLNRNYFNHLSRYRLIQLPEPGRNLQMVLTFQF